MLQYTDIHHQAMLRQPVIASTVWTTKRVSACSHHAAHSVFANLQTRNAIPQFDGDESDVTKQTAQAT